jgi:aspartate ammonia-lyase
MLVCMGEESPEGVGGDGRSIVEIAREKKLLNEGQIAEILDPKNMTEPRPR